MKYALTTALIIFSIEPALAFDSQKWAQVDQSTRDWFKGLRSPSGFPCCDFADGNRVEDPDWRQNEDGSYSVIWEGEWRQVPPERVLTGTNRVGYAILWWHKGVDNPYCFLPGARG